MTEQNDKGSNPAVNCINLCRNLSNLTQLEIGDMAEPAFSCGEERLLSELILHSLWNAIPRDWCAQH